MAKGYYNGAEPCVGCGTPGNTRSRSTKAGLCEVCMTDLKHGRSTRTSLLGYCSFRQHYHAYRNDKTNRLVHAVLAALHNPDIPGSHLERVDPLHSTFGDNCVWYVIPMAAYVPLKEFFRALDDELTEIKKTKERMPEEAKAIVQAEYDIVYNAGVKAGQNLLFQLEAGTITMEQFAENLKYHKA